MTEKVTVIATLTRSELARLQRQFNHKQQAEQLERFIADSGYLLMKPQLIQLADQELDAAADAWKKTSEKYGFVESDNIEVDFAKMQIVKKDEVDDSDAEPLHLVDSSAADEGGEQHGIDAESGASGSAAGVGHD